MFNFFKRGKKKKQLNNWEKELLLRILLNLGKLYTRYIEQINEGIIVGIRFSDVMPNYVGFRLNSVLLNKYEKKSQTPTIISNIFVLDKDSEKMVPISIHLGFGLILGYQLANRDKFNPDINKIDITNVIISDEVNEEFEEIKGLFNNAELNYVNISDVYSIELNGKKYYHILDLEDGDFIGVDINKHIYKISHDPFLIKKLGGELIDILRDLK